MIRFRNPGTQYDTQLQVIKQLYENLKDQSSFTLEDMARVIAQGRLMTAYGYAGQGAIQLSKDKAQESLAMNSSLMNVKMYAEVFRMLGWVTPVGDKSYPLVFTYIGIHMATAANDEVKAKLYEQCVLGINHPTELTTRMKYDEKVRFFKCALRTFIDLGGIMYKHELCLGPMSVDDEDEDAYQKMIARIKKIRGDYSRLDKEFKKLSASLGMKTYAVDNCTRLPIAFMKSCGFVKSIRDTSLYNKSLDCLQITEHGIDVYNSIKDACDIRLDAFKKFTYEEQNALIRLGVFSMLERSGFNLDEVSKQIRSDEKTCLNILQGRELLFSPCQTLRRGEIESALGNVLSAESSKRNTCSDDTSSNILSETRFAPDSHYGKYTTTHNYIVNKFKLDKNMIAAKDLLTEPEDEQFLNMVLKLTNKGKNSEQIVEYLYNYYQEATQSTFYPLVATLFKIMGYDCSFSRPGDNGSRWDAIIKDPKRSIPIEIKSPTEVRELSIKAIRQALENKIVLLSRKTFLTQPEVTTLAVGNDMPGDRTDINDLIEYIRNTYGYRVGIIDLKTLLTISISILINHKGFDREKLYSLEGLLNADIH